MCGQFRTDARRFPLHVLPLYWKPRPGRRFERCLFREPRAAPSRVRRERYVERLWSGSCSPRRAISARLQAQCRPSVSPVGQSLRAVGRSGSWELLRSSAPLCFSAAALLLRCSAPLRVQQPAVFTATAGLCLLCCLTNSDGCSLPLCRGWLRTRTSSCSVDGCSHDAAAGCSRDGRARGQS